MKRAAGTSKIVWKNAKKGDVDIYIKKSWLNAYEGTAKGGILSALGLILPGPGWTIALGGIAGAIQVGGKHKHSKVFVVRGFRYRYSYLQ